MKDSGLKLALVESMAPIAPAPEWTSRVFAISPGSIEFLSESGAWQQFDAARIAPVLGMHIYGDDGKASLDFDAHQSGLAELAVIAEVRHMQHGLWQALQRQENLELFCPARCASLRLQEEVAVLRLEDGRELRAAADCRRGRAGILGALAGRNGCRACALPSDGGDRQFRNRTAPWRCRLGMVSRRRRAGLPAPAGQSHFDRLDGVRGARGRADGAAAGRVLPSGAGSEPQRPGQIDTAQQAVPPFRCACCTWSTWSNPGWR